MSPDAGPPVPDRHADDGRAPAGGHPTPGPGDGPTRDKPGMPPPSPPDAFGPEQMHSSLTPRGEHVAWSALGSLLAGPIVWGGVGFLLDRWLGTGRILTAVGVVVGSLTAFYIVYLRFGREERVLDRDPADPSTREGPPC